MAEREVFGVRPRQLLGRYRRGLREIGLIVAIALLYYVTRGLAIGQETAALANARALIDLERRLRLFHEPAINAAIAGVPALVGIVNWIYTYLHMPVLIAFAVWVNCCRPAQYVAIRSIFLASAAAGLITYAFFPVAPPRLLPEYGFTDTLTRYSNIHFDTGPIKLFYNPYAALPSLHFGWSLLVGLGLCWLGRRPLVRTLGVVLPLLMLIAIVGTGNHFFLDAVGGALVLIFGCLVGFRAQLVEWWQARGVGRQPVVGSG